MTLDEVFCHKRNIHFYVFSKPKSISGDYDWVYDTWTHARHTPSHTWLIVAGDDGIVVYLLWWHRQCTTTYSRTADSDVSKWSYFKPAIFRQVFTRTLGNGTEIIYARVRLRINWKENKIWFVCFEWIRCFAHSKLKKSKLRHTSHRQFVDSISLRRDWNYSIVCG